MNSPPKNTSAEEFGGQLMGKSDQFGRSEAEWLNQHQAADPKPDDRINIRRPIRSRMAESTSDGRRSRMAESTPGGRRSRATDPTIGYGRTQAEIKWPKLNDRTNARRRSSRHSSRQRLLKPVHRGARWHYLHNVRYPHRQLPKPSYGGARQPLFHNAHHSASHDNG